MSKPIFELNLFDAIDMLDDPEYSHEIREHVYELVISTIKEGMDKEFYEKSGHKFVMLLEGFYSLLVKIGDDLCEADEETIAETRKSGEKTKKKYSDMIKLQITFGDIKI